MTSKRLLSSFILFQFYFSFSYYRGVSTVVWSFAFKSKSKSLSHSGKNKSHYLARGIGRIREGEGERQGRGGPITTTTTAMMMDQSPNHSTPVFAGFDLGTSGARISIIESSSTCGGGFREIYTNSITWKDCVDGNSSKDNNSDGDSGGDGDGDGEGRYDNPNSWWIAIENLLEGCCNHRSNIASICVSGTSASCLIVDRTTLEVKRNPRMYDYDIITSSSSSSSSDNNNNNNNNNNDNGHIGLRASELLQKYLPSKHTARANTSSFAKLIKWILESPLQTNEKLCHQSDYISSKLLFSTTATAATAVNDTDNDNNEKKKEGIGMQMQMQIQSDWHNCLKLGYDVRNQCWPSSNTNNNWMELCLRESVRISNNYKNSNNNNNNSADIDIIDSSDDNTNMIHKILPTTVVSPGFPIGTINECVAEKLGLSKDVIIIAGTTDSNAAFFAAAASDLGSSVDDDVDDDDDAGDITGSSEIRIPYGTAVTSLGSTTAIKFLSKTYVEDSSLGVYSHRFPSRKVFSTTTTANNNNDNDENEEQEAWLVGGASNVGCAVFRALNFTDDELQSRSMDIDPTTDSESYLRYKYYPLLPNKIGERFPIADSTKQSVLEPIPDSGDRTEYLKGLFQSISEVERKGYDVLRDLGSNPSFPTRIMTSGGGSKNTVWISLRQRIMNSNNNNIINNMAGIDDTTDKIEVQTAEHAEASYGAALLAAAGFRVQKSKT